MPHPIILLITACLGATNPAGAEQASAPWLHRVLIASDRGLGGAAIGELIAQSVGNEVAAVDAGGAVWLAQRTDDAWSARTIHRSAGELIMCAIGDADPFHPGNEFVGVGMVDGPEELTGPGQAVMLRRAGDTWLGERIFQDDHMLHGVAIGDVCPEHAGNEVVVCGFNHRVSLLSRHEEGWTSETIYVGNDRLKVVQIGDLLPERPGDEALVCGMDGKVVVLWRDRLGWKHEVIFSDAVGQSRIALGDGEVLVGGDGGQVTRVQRLNGVWRSTFLFRDNAKMRGVAIADLDGTSAGGEYYACGYSGKVTRIVSQPQDYWLAQTVFDAQHPLHHLVAGELDASHDGPELITCGLGGKLYLLTPPVP